MKNGAIRHLDISPFPASNPWERKCGFDSAWNPADHVAEIGTGGNAVTMANLFNLFNAGICSANYTNFGADTGFPQAGEYHSEFKVSHNGMTWHARVRYTVTGSKAGAFFVDEGIAVPADLINTLEYAVDGVTVAHGGVFSAMVDAMTASSTDAPGATLTVKPSAAGSVVFTGNAELICVTKS